MPKNSLARGTTILFAGNLINRFIGFFLRIYLIRLIGVEGVGLFQRVTSLFFTLLIITTAGFPVAVPIMVAAEEARSDYVAVHRITRLAFALILTAGLLTCALTLWQAETIAVRLLGDRRALTALITVAPALFFCAGTAILRGYFQGVRQMAPIAWSQITEEIAQVAITVTCLLRWSPLNLTTAVSCLALGFVGSEAAGFLVAAFAYLRCRRRDFAPAAAPPRGGQNSPAPRTVLRQIARLAAPVTAYRLILSLASSLNAILIPARLQAAGATLSAATAQFGQLTGVAVTLVFLPTVFTQALTANLIPAVAETAARPDRRAVRRQIRKAIKLTYLVGLPAAALLIRLAGPLTAVIFRSPGAAGPLVVLSAGAVFIYLQQVTSGILNGLGRTAVPGRNMLAASALSLALIYRLTIIPSCGILGAAAGLTAGNCLGCLLNLLSLRSVADRLFDLPHLLRTGLSAVLAGFAAAKLYELLWLPAGSLAALLLAGTAGCLVYAGALLCLRAARTD